MPTLKMKKGKDEYYIQTSVSGQVITFQLTGAGRQKLYEAGLQDGSRFGRVLLLSLIQSGDAFTHGTGFRGTPESDRQLELDFPDDPYAEKTLPACSECSSLDNLHLVTTAARPEEKYDAYILCAACREKRPRDVSIPIGLVSRSAFLRLQEWKLFEHPESRVKAYGDALNTDFEKKWEELRKQRDQARTGFLPMQHDSRSRLFD